MERVYKALGMDFSAARQHVEQYCAGLKKAYRKNTHHDLRPDIKKQINERWREHFEVFGYDLEPVE